MEFTPDGPMAIPLWINGHAYLTATESFFDVAHPVSDDIIRRVPLCGAGEAAAAVEAARVAQEGWAQLGMAARQQRLQALAQALDNYRGHFSKLLMQESATEQPAAEAEVDAAVAALRAGDVGRAGLLGLLPDRQQPLLNFVRLLAPAMMAGATAVVKPSPKAPAAIFALCELTARCDWPAGVVNVLQGDSAALAGLCAEAPDVLQFVGDDALATKISAMAAAAGVPFEHISGC